MLTRVKESLEKHFASVSIRGDGDSSFVFVEHCRRAVELSWNGTGWWLEFWDSADDENAPAIAERTVGTEAEAVDAIKEWLIRR